MDSAETAARLGVLHTITSYTRLGDAARFDEFAGLFGDDGVLEVKGPRRNQGRAEIVAFLQEVGAAFTSKPGFLPARHHVSSTWIDVVSDTEARAVSYFLLVARYGPDHWGVYRDRLVRDGDGDAWRFAHRRVVLEGSLPDSPVASMVEGTA